MMHQLILWLVLFLLSTGCNSILKVQTDYVTHKDLASYYVNTPDPRQNMTTVGQRLIVSWIVPKSYLCYDDLHLEINIRFRNREEIVEIFPISKMRGTYVFALFNADYFAKQGILTYKVNLIGNGLVLEEWRHRIWTDLITLQAEESGDCSSEQSDGALPQNQEEEEYPIDWDA